MAYTCTLPQPPNTPMETAITLEAMLDAEMKLVDDAAHRNHVGGKHSDDDYKARRLAEKAAISLERRKLIVRIIDSGGHERIGLVSTCAESLMTDADLFLNIMMIEYEVWEQFELMRFAAFNRAVRVLVGHYFKQPRLVSLDTATDFANRPRPSVIACMEFVTNYADWLFALRGFQLVERLTLSITVGANSQNEVIIDTIVKQGAAYLIEFLGRGDDRTPDDFVLHVVYVLSTLGPIGQRIIARIEAFLTNDEWDAVCANIEPRNVPIDEEKMTTRLKHHLTVGSLEPSTGTQPKSQNHARGMKRTRSVHWADDAAITNPDANGPT